jgi:hypothetical protein
VHRLNPYHKTMTDGPDRLLLGLLSIDDQSIRDIDEAHIPQLHQTSLTYSSRYRYQRLYKQRHGLPHPREDPMHDSMRTTACGRNLGIPPRPQPWDLETKSFSCTPYVQLKRTNQLRGDWISHKHIAHESSKRRSS